MFLKLVIFWLNCGRLHDDINESLNTILDRVNFQPIEENEFIEIYVSAKRLSFARLILQSRKVRISPDHVHFILEVMAELTLKLGEVNFVFWKIPTGPALQRRLIDEYRNKVPTLKQICIRKIRYSVGFLTQENLERLRLPPKLQKEISLAYLRKLILRQLNSKRTTSH